MLYEYTKIHKNQIFTSVINLELIKIQMHSMHFKDVRMCFKQNLAGLHSRCSSQFVDLGSEVIGVNTRASSRFEFPSKDRFMFCLFFYVQCFEPCVISQKLIEGCIINDV